MIVKDIPYGILFVHERTVYRKAARNDDGMESVFAIGYLQDGTVPNEKVVRMESLLELWDSSTHYHRKLPQDLDVRLLTHLVTP